MLLCHVGDDLELRSLSQSDAEAMYSLIVRNRAHLDRWLRWSGRIHTLDDVRTLIQRFEAKETVGDGFHAGMWFNGQMAGGLVCHFINRESNKSEIGYWLGADFTKRGLVTRACSAIITRLIEQEKMHRIELQIATDNESSKAVAVRLGFTFEGIKRQSDWITSSYRDHAMYGLLASEWDHSASPS